ncbi:MULTISPECIES: FecR family protein [unclassified Pedobacter]|uniref:FecR family protein n=1 Tax=unclassified Pedobacter TaxID=2628915 RepID=UPI001422EBCD|nr:MULTISPECIES: FecR family protein [unclassified Pedobacter]NII85771.1 ferric-dicitrate binding protein FerR (iron transport regulator) [Pedobacter sp. SG908]NMN39312.1 ferric-dicitrate binding protein FerR (iron transport regulator) [Pedobacter sp. SG918]
MEERIHYLLQQFTAKTLSQAEREELLVLAEDSTSLLSDEIVKMIIEEEEHAVNVVDEKWNPVLNKILAVDKPTASPKRILMNSLKWAAAAVVFIVFSFTAYLSLQKKKEHVFATDVAPGKNKAILTLADGKKISLSDAMKGDVVKEAGFSITKTADGQLVYNVAGSENVNDTRLNTISTPNGGEWQIQLPDGSTVWLNAASSIQYSLNIGTAKQRVVKLDGEAYFEVAKNATHPFIVETDKQSVEVLGTHFNINSYKDEKVTKTTLLEGSVRVSHNATNEHEVLKPGEQSLVSVSGIAIKEVNVDEAIAWKKGYFMFNNERQESILRKVARWYNVEIEYADADAKNVMYYGTVSRFEKISKVLTKFEQTGEVRFDIKGNKVIVYKE